MILQIVNSDFSNAGIGSIGQVVKIEKTDTTTDQISLGTGFSNGEKLAYHVKITDIGEYTENSLSFGFAVADSPTALNAWMTGYPHVTLNNVQTGSEFTGEVEIDHLTEVRTYVIFAVFNPAVGSHQRTVKFELEYLKV